MSLFVPRARGDFVLHDEDRIRRELQDGNPSVGWPGDRRLMLVQKVIRLRSPGGGHRTGRRWEVWRACEDGQDRFIGSWPLDQSHRIIPDLAKMRAERPGGGADERLAEIDRHNQALEADRQRQAEEAWLQMLEHMAWAEARLSGPRTVFGMRGPR